LDNFKTFNLGLNTTIQNIIAIDKKENDFSDSIDLQISKEWLFNHLQSDFYTKNSQKDFLS
jgi:hypothetical protein